VLPDGLTGDDLRRLHLRLRNLQAVARAVATLLDCARDLERQGRQVPSEHGDSIRPATWPRTSCSPSASASSW
jgi:hypothetical protein